MGENLAEVVRELGSVFSPALDGSVVRVLLIEIGGIGSSLNELNKLAENSNACVRWWYR